MGYDTLQNWFRTNFSLVQHHHWSLSDIENMMPWEKIVYVDLLKQHIKQKEENERLRMMAAKARK